MRSITKHTGFLVLAAGLLLGTGGCSEEVKPTPLTYSQLLTGTESKSWRLTNIRVFDAGDDSGPINVQQNFEPCVADDLYVFYANDIKSFEVQEGASKCNAADPDVFVENNWSVVNATATVSFVMPLLTTEFPLPFTLKSLTESAMTVEFYFEDLDLSYRFTFAAQTGR
jgi:hypothetical protein